MGDGALEAGAALLAARGDGQPGGGGAGAGQMARHFGAQPARGAQADAFDLAEPLAIGVQLRRGAGVRGDLLLEGCDFLGQRALHAPQAFGPERLGFGEAAIALGLEHGFEIGQAAQEAAQALLGLRRGLPGGQRAVAAAEAGNELGVDPIGLVAPAQAAREVFDAARIGQMDAMAGLVEPGGRQLAGAAGGFEHDERRGGAEFLAPGAQGGETARGVVELRVMRPGAGEQAGIELGFGDIEAGRSRQRGHVGGEVEVGFGWPFEASPVEHGLVCGLPRVKLRSWIPSGFVPETRRERVPISNGPASVLHYRGKRQAVVERSEATENKIQRKAA